MTDIFQYSNVYAVKPEITRLFDPKYGLAQECLGYIMLPSILFISFFFFFYFICYLFILFIDAPEISVERVYALYCGLKYGLTVKDWMEEQQLSSFYIDERYTVKKKKKITLI